MTGLHRFRWHGVGLAVVLGALALPGYAQLAAPERAAVPAASLGGDDAIEQAQQSLSAAERALQDGRTPLPGERRGNVNGYSRLTPAYFARIAALEQKVESARQQLNEANAASRTLR